jgi:hypothetical protein
LDAKSACAGSSEGSGRSEFGCVVAMVDYAPMRKKVFVVALLTVIALFTVFVFRDQFEERETKKYDTKMIDVKKLRNQMRYRQ